MIYRLFAGSVDIIFSFIDEPAKLSHVSMARFYVLGFIISVFRVPFFRVSLSSGLIIQISWFFSVFHYPGVSFFRGVHFLPHTLAAASACMFSSFKNISRGFFDFWSDWLLLHEKKAIIL
ncbi:MAG: hypothetical protein KGY60_03660 [Bacteroidales bacterium]|nr:hypothetical protein [Bacteroidales bacterium]